ncbi:MAG: hypothetical protein GC186_16510 [Rhodobacteraceae bacterium]|nr:hypothetical protein [Paracoccaceae bacterium]
MTTTTQATVLSQAQQFLNAAAQAAGMDLPFPTTTQVDSYAPLPDSLPPASQPASQNNIVLMVLAALLIGKYVL